MTSRHLPHLPLAVFCLAALLALPAAAAPRTAKTTPAPLPACGVPGTIQHVIFIIKENRTFDHYFGTFPGANGATTATDSTGAVVSLKPASDTNFGCDIDHSYQGAHTGYDCGAMDMFDLIGYSNHRTGCDTTQPPPYTNHSLTQFVQSQIPNYWAYAQHFTLGDHMFSSVMGPSYTNHLFTIGAQSGGPATGDGAINNPSGGTGSNGWGCDKAGQVVQTLPFGPPVCPAPTNYGSHSSCWDFRVLPDEIEAAGLDWRYYAPAVGTSGYIWSALNAISHIRNVPAEWAKVVPYTQFITDATAGTLPAVSWLTFPGECSDHAPNSVCEGENYTVQVLNALMQGPDWCTSAAFVVWDDFGGFYDHMSPPNTTSTVADVYGPGFRVPLLVISPYAKASFIDHSPYEFSSLLKFAEVTFGLSPLTLRDTNTNNMLAAFNFQHVTSRFVLAPNTSCPLNCTSAATAAKSKKLPDSDVLDDDD
ncbi:MAG TPA: alkaline phosphatase family protein [Thermoanaerobaculia bacterium]|jgi:phospholipase C|nr:alkaline phosphatase family protein [Thermoanaerobaculia bacterium]